LPIAHWSRDFESPLPRQKKASENPVIAAGLAAIASCAQSLISSRAPSNQPAPMATSNRPWSIAIDYPPRMYTIVIGNKRYSSWSMRPWLALSLTGAPFDEIVIPLDRPDTKAKILEYSPAGRVPVLRHGDLTVWDSLAITEYLHERHPEAGLWPADPASRAVARSAVAEMHSGFGALRQNMSMDLGASKPGQGHDAPGVRQDIDRIRTLWGDLRARYGRGGDFLFGSLTVADAFFAPVATRFRTYGVTLDPVSERYVEAIYGWPAFRSWLDAAAREPWVRP
jgi:glutathione S-transferase